MKLIIVGYSCHLTWGWGHSWWSCTPIYWNPGFGIVGQWFGQLAAHAFRFVA